MTLYFTLTAKDRVLAIHQTLAEARAFAGTWRDMSTANRVADRIVAGLREAANIRPRSDLFKIECATATYAI